MKTPNYRITFSDGPLGIRRKSVDVFASNSDDAFAQAQKMAESKNNSYTDVSVEKIPEEASPIGICFQYTDTKLGKKFRNHLIIKADNEDQAVSYYNNNVKGKRFWFNPGDLDETGKCVYGEVLETYFASCHGCDFDATIN